MINLDKNSNNLVVLTLTEKSTLLNPNYLFSFTSTTNYNNVVNFIATDTSAYKSRYYRFTIIESGTTFTNLTGGTINLNPNGMWDYTIYEQISPTNLQISGTTGVVEVGKVIVNGVDISIPDVYR
jgi:hypothetical protein